MASSTAQAGQDSAQQSKPGGGKNRMLIYIAALIVLLVVIGFLFISSIGSGLPGTANLPESNATPIYLSASDAQLLLGSPTSNYTTVSMYNMTSPYNITLFEAIVPQLSGNVTNGWSTIANGTAADNASIFYNVFQTGNGEEIAGLFAQAISSSFPTIPNISNGSENGMNYTYEIYTNSTASLQALIGWKDGYVSLVQIYADSPTTNQSEMAGIASSNIQ
jgi:hypothetical protein